MEDRDFVRFPLLYFVSAYMLVSLCGICFILILKFSKLLDYFNYHENLFWLIHYMALRVHVYLFIYSHPSFNWF